MSQYLHGAHEGASSRDGFLERLRQQLDLPLKVGTVAGALLGVLATRVIYEPVPETVGLGISIVAALVGGLAALLFAAISIYRGKG